MTACEHGFRSQRVRIHKGVGLQLSGISDCLAPICRNMLQSHLTAFGTFDFSLTRQQLAQSSHAVLAKKASTNFPFGWLKGRLKTTYMPRHTASYDPFNMTCENINQNITLKAPASRPLISCKSSPNPTHSAAL